MDHGRPVLYSQRELHRHLHVKAAALLALLLTGCSSHQWTDRTKVCVGVCVESETDSQTEVGGECTKPKECKK